MEAPDPHPFSYPARFMPQGSISSSQSNTSNFQQPAEKSSRKRHVPCAPSAALSMAMVDSHPLSYPAKRKPSQMYAEAEPGPSVTQPLSKKARTKRVLNPDASAVEKRGAREKKSCPKTILDRVDRVMSQRCV